MSPDEQSQSGTETNESSNDSSVDEQISGQSSVTINEENESIKMKINLSPRKTFTPLDENEPNILKNDKAICSDASETPSGELSTKSENDSETSQNQSVQQKKSDEVVEEIEDTLPDNETVDIDMVSEKNLDSANKTEQVEEKCEVPNESSNHSGKQVSDEVEEKKQTELSVSEKSPLQPAPDIVSPSPNNNSQFSIESKEKIVEDGEKPRATLTRGRLLSNSKSISNEDSPAQSKSSSVPRKRRWGGGASNEQSASFTLLKKGISSEAIKQLISKDLNNSGLSEAKVSKVEESVGEVEDLSDVTKENVVFSDTSDMVKKEETRNSLDTTNENSKEVTEQFREVSPAKNAPSTVLFITGLVRPYTLPQLKKVLSATGTIDEDKFWIDKIKSKCYVAYSSVEEAVASRQALHNFKWPQSSPKTLSVDFATLEDIDRSLNPENYEETQGKKSTPSNEMKHDGNIAREKLDYVSKEKNRVEIKKVEAEPRTIREWDRNKVKQLDEQNTDHRRGKNEDIRKRSLSPPAARSRKDRSRKYSSLVFGYDSSFVFIMKYRKPKSYP